MLLIELLLQNFSTCVVCNNTFCKLHLFIHEKTKTTSFSQEKKSFMLLIELFCRISPHMMYVVFNHILCKLDLFIHDKTKRTGLACS